MFRFIFKLIIVLSIIAWSINANASNCLKNNNQNPIVETYSGIFVVDVLNARTGSGLQYCIERVLNNVKGKEVQIVGSMKNWRMALIDGQNLWIHKSLITQIPPLNLKVSS